MRGLLNEEHGQYDVRESFKRGVFVDEFGIENPHVRERAISINEIAERKKMSEQKQKQIKTRLKKYKTCKHSVRYDVADDTIDPAIMSIYVRNSTVEELGDPDEVIVIIEKGE